MRRITHAQIVMALLFIAALAPAATLVDADDPAAQTIQTAIDGLTSGRQHIETVKCVGRFEVGRSLVVPSFTRLDLTEARLMLAQGAEQPLIVNADPDGGNHHIEIVGGILDGNGGQQGTGQHHGILFIRVSESSLADLEVRNVTGDGIRLSGQGRHTRNLRLDGLYIHDNGWHGLNIMWAMRQIVVSNVILNGNQIGLRSDHSEGLYTNVSADGNSLHGVFIRNVFGNQYANLTATRNGGHGIHVLGMVESLASGWHAHGNSRGEPGRYSDLFFDGDVSLSYGLTAHCVFTAVRTGGYGQYGPNSEKHALEFAAPGEGRYEDLCFVGLGLGTAHDDRLVLPADRSGLTFVGLDPPQPLRSAAQWPQR